MHTPTLRAALSLCALMLIALALSLTGCATPSPPEVIPTPLRLPAPPPLTEPPPPKSYSDSVRERLQIWRKRLTDTQATHPP